MFFFYFSLYLFFVHITKHSVQSIFITQFSEQTPYLLFLAVGCRLFDDNVFRVSCLLCCLLKMFNVWIKLFPSVLQFCQASPFVSFLFAFFFLFPLSSCHTPFSSARRRHLKWKICLKWANKGMHACMNMLVPCFSRTFFINCSLSIAMKPEKDNPDPCPTLNFLHLLNLLNSLLDFITWSFHDLFQVFQDCEKPVFV